MRNRRLARHCFADRLLSSTGMHNRRLARRRLANRLLSSTRMRQPTDHAQAGVDGTPVEAEAGLKSLRAELPVASCDADSAERPDTAEARCRQRFALVQPPSGPTPKRVASNATRCRGLIRDARLRHESGHRKHLVLAVGRVDPKHRVIVAVQADEATAARPVLESVLARHQQTRTTSVRACICQLPRGAVSRSLDAHYDAVHRPAPAVC
jgi:hypothetical protein